MLSIYRFKVWYAGVGCMGGGAGPPMSSSAVRVKYLSAVQDGERQVSVVIPSLLVNKTRHSIAGERDHMHECMISTYAWGQQGS